MLRVSAASNQNRAEAIALLLGHLTQFERAQQTRELLASAARGEVDLDQLLVAREGERVLGTALMIPQADGTVFVWPPAVCADEVQDISAALLDEVRRRVETCGAWIGQCLVEPGETDVRNLLDRSQFHHLTDLTFLQRSLEEPLPERLPTPLAFETFSAEENFDRFVRTIEATYEGTQDCPELNGIRSGAEALAGHRESGTFSAARWRLYRLGDRDVGLVLLTAHPADHAWELVYLGTVPEARGHGYARTMLVDSLHEARAQQAASMVLAVDQRNVMAQKLYRSAGFCEVLVRSVHVYSPRGDIGRR
jgi:ribosomal protein S18 acetylase RimI-like enzyme